MGRDTNCDVSFIRFSGSAAFAASPSLCPFFPPLLTISHLSPLLSLAFFPLHCGPSIRLSLFSSSPLASAVPYPWPFILALFHHPSWMVRHHHSSIPVFLLSPLFLMSSPVLSPSSWCQVASAPHCHLSCARTSHLLSSAIVGALASEERSS